MDPNTPRAEAERWLGIAVKLLTARDFLGSKTFAIRARESDPSNQVSDQILAVIETVLAGEKRVNSSQHPDWYTVLQLPRLVRDPELIANHYRKLVTLLNPDRNRVPFADYALQLVMDAWSILSDPNKKWLFDNELAVYLQHQQIPQQQAQQPQLQTAAAAAAAQQINTFQFFQPPPQQQLQQQQPQQLPQAAVSMWQQQEDHFSQNNNNFSSGGSSSNQLQQIEFMQMQQQLPLRPQLQQQPQQQSMQLPPQWQMRDPTPAKGGDRNKGVVNGIASGLGMSGLQGTAVNTTVPVITTPIMQTQMMPRPGLVQAQQPPVVVPVQHQAQPVEVRTTFTDGNVGINNVVNSSVGNNNNNDNNNAGVVHENDDAVNANVNADKGDVAADEGNKGGEKEVECFWTSCPYCLYIFEYQIVYKECTLRCQNCGRGFHAVQIPNPPPISDPGDGGGDKDKDSKESSFCCWGFFPLGFSTAAWRKQNKMGKSNVGTNWVPFSPMFACPVENGNEKFQWFGSSDGAAVGPKNMGRLPVSQPRVYFDDDIDDFNSDPSDSDSSDDDWRRHNAPEKKKKKKRRRKGGIGRPPTKHKHEVANVQTRANHNSAAGRGVSAGVNGLEGESNTQNVVVFSLAAGANKEDARKKVATGPTATLTRNQARRRAKNMGRLDLNVEFNNEGDEQAPTASAVNGGEVGVENIEFFEGLDEFFSTLPILNVDGVEKAKPS